MLQILLTACRDAFFWAAWCAAFFVTIGFVAMLFDRPKSKPKSKDD